MITLSFFFLSSFSFQYLFRCLNSCTKFLQADGHWQIVFPEELKLYIPDIINIWLNINAQHQLSYQLHKTSCQVYKYCYTAQQENKILDIYSIH